MVVVVQVAVRLYGHATSDQGIVCYKEMVMVTYAEAIITDRGKSPHAHIRKKC